MSQITNFEPYVHTGESFEDRARYFDTIIGKSLVAEAFAVYGDEAAADQFPQTS